MIRFVLLVLLLLAPNEVRAQTLAERFEAAAKRSRPTAISLLENRIDDRKSLVEAAKRGPVNQPKNDYSSTTAPDGHVLHNFSFRTAADRKEITARYQKQLTDAARDLKDVKAETAWPACSKQITELEVGDFVWLEGEYRIALKETDESAWIEKLGDDQSGVFYLEGADLSRYADGKTLDFVDSKMDLLFWVKGTRLKPDSLGLPSVGKTLYELEMISVAELTKQLPAGVRILQLGAVPVTELEKDLPTPDVMKR